MSEMRTILVAEAKITAFFTFAVLSGDVVTAKVAIIVPSDCP